jgi:NADH-quinone oxidoreductase subunit C
MAEQNENSPEQNLKQTQEELNPSKVSKLRSSEKSLLRLLENENPVPNSVISQSLDEIVLSVPTEEIQEAALKLRQSEGFAFDYLRCLSVVDYEEYFEIVYHIWSRLYRHKLTLKTTADYNDPIRKSVTPIWKSADWFEREGHELFGIDFKGHGNLKPLLLWEGFEGYPGRKSYPFHEYSEW